MKKIAIQGIKGCFHHISIIKYLGKNYYEIIECKNFNKLTLSVTNIEANLGIIAIENTIIGSLLSNYIFLSNHNLKILYSIIIYIEQNFMAFINKIFNNILSHIIALQQCDNFIFEYTHSRIIKYNDTALASLYISKNMYKKKIAIASKLASKEYKLKIIDKNIQNSYKNFTIFFIIELLQKIIKENWDKSSILFSFKINCYNKFLIILSFIEKKK